MKRFGSAFVVVVLAVVAVSACRSDSSAGTSTSAASATTAASPTGGGTATSGSSFGSLTDVCGPGKPTSKPAQGVTPTEIDVSTFTDMGFTKSSEMPDAAAVFTSWCNAAGGINGRKIVSHTRDARLTEDRQRMLEACAHDFAVVGGGVAFDQAGVKDRLKCLMPEIPAQSVSVANTGSDLQVMISFYEKNFSPYEGYYDWLINDGYPSSKSAVGIIAGDAPVTKDIADVARQLLEALGGKVPYHDLYPATGASDWTPYAQSIKDEGVRGLIFFGDYRNLAKLEQSLTDIGYVPDWIDANSSAYSAEFLQLAATVLDKQVNLVPMSIYPPELAAGNPATKQLVDLYHQYKPGAAITLPAVQAFSAWLMFALAARDCGDQLTRRCLYDNAVKYRTAGWDGGGLTPPAAAKDAGGKPATCWSIMKATPAGWKVVDIKPDTGFYRCSALTVQVALKGKPTTLADVGKTMADVK